jgi:hypothetical protein
MKGLVREMKNEIVGVLKNELFEQLMREWAFTLWACLAWHFSEAIYPASSIILKILLSVYGFERTLNKTLRSSLWHVKPTRKSIRTCQSSIQPWNAAVVYIKIPRKSLHTFYFEERYEVHAVGCVRGYVRVKSKGTRWDSGSWSECYRNSSNRKM